MRMSIKFFKALIPTFISILTLVSVLSSHPALADRGVLPIEDAIIYQHGQVAAIAWRDGEEVPHPFRFHPWALQFQQRVWRYNGGPPSQ